MPPEIYINGKLVAEVPDQSGTYDSAIGPITVDSSRIKPDSKQQEIVIDARRVGKVNEPRRISLSKKGIGSGLLNPNEIVEVRLERPIKTPEGDQYYPDYPNLKY